jgi:L-ribulose-5-phosphate 3-epimerase
VGSSCVVLAVKAWGLSMLSLAFALNLPPTMNPMPSYSRRDFLTTCAGAAIAAPLLASTKAAASEASTHTMSRGPIEAPGAIHVFSKPFHGMSYRETAELIAEAGFGGIDYTVRSGGHIRPERVEEDLPRAVEAARAAGLKVEMISSEIVRLDAPHARKTIECAARLGIKVYRLGSLRYDLKKSVWATLMALKPAMRELAEFNQTLGIQGAIQNHSGNFRVGAALWDLFELVRELDPRWLGCQYDIRHATVIGAQSWQVTLELLHPWIRSTDLKDFRWIQEPGKQTIENVPLGEGIVEFPQYFGRVRELQIGGPRSVHLEYPPFEHGPDVSHSEKRALFLAAMKKDADTLNRYLAAAEAKVG